MTHETHVTPAARSAGDPGRTRLRIVTPCTMERALAKRGLEGLLSRSERSVFESFAVERRRRDWLAGRLAAKLAVRAALRAGGGGTVPPYAITVVNDPNGAPCVHIDDRSAPISTVYNISIAHDEGFAMCALAHTRETGFVGVDLERDRPLRARFIRYVLTESERRRLATTEPSLAPPPLAIWTLKEAVVKAARQVSSEARWVAMREVDLTWRGHRRVTARLVSGSTSAVRITARWRRWGRHVLAYAACRATETN